MLKIAPPAINVFQNLKCGEIFCISPAVYNVACCLCTTKMHLDQFASHFQMQHLTLAEESINLEELEKKRKAKLAKDANLVDNMSIKEEDPEDDPIKQEEGELDEDDKSLKQLLRDSERIRDKLDNKECFPIELEVCDVKIADNPNLLIEQEKNSTRKSKKCNKPSILDDKKTQEQILYALNTHSLDENEKESDCEYDDNFKNECDDDTEMDKDWSLEDKLTETFSDFEEKNKPKDDIPYPCHTCNRTYSSKRSLQKHNYSVHNPNKPPRKKGQRSQHKCDQCNDVFRSARELRGHKWKHTGIFCDICGKPFTQTGNMMRHKIRHTGIKAHKCKDCNKEFFTDKELKSHIICHTGLMPVICEICGKQCRDRGVLTAHMRRHTGERPAKCDVCGKSFFSFHDLNVHAVTHSSERPFKCDVCGSTFQRKKALRVHKLIHSKDRKHVCKICGKGFSQSGGLNSHMRTHDAALEKSNNETAQQTPIPISLENSSTHTENQCILNTSSHNKAVNNEEENILGPYVV